MPRRGTTVQRGYGQSHKRIRAMLLPMAIGQPCPRCGETMWATDDLDLGHDDDDRSRYNGIEHAKCNRSAGAAQGNKKRGGRYRGLRRRQGVNVKADDL
ncbi:MAG TPA: hypothetical protein VHV10_18890 [Ktedonobacteraceae bacterium]|nr:hypothetical protein [Ktedonobacteraceae bacterium]